VRLRDTRLQPRHALITEILSPCHRRRCNECSGANAHIAADVESFLTAMGSGRGCIQSRRADDFSSGFWSAVIAGGWPVESPSITGMLGPRTSASTSPMRPAALLDRERRLTLTVDLPTPPLPCPPRDDVPDSWQLFRTSGRDNALA
jgi:hypothetical protein